MTSDLTAGTVQGVVLREVGGPLTVEEVVLPALGPTDVRVRVLAAGVCHSDLSLATGVLRQPVPAVLGHEGSGVVEAVGPDVTGLAVGDQVVLCWAPPCRGCVPCLRGEPWMCARSSDRAAVPYATLTDGTPLYPGLSTAAFAEATVVPARACVRVPEDVPLDLAALVGCAVATGVGAVVNTAQLRPGQTALVIGLGGVGLSAVQGARLAGAATVIVVDPSEAKRDLALALGGTHALEPGDDLAKAVRGLTGGEGVDHAFEAVGRASTIRAAWSATRRGGRVTVLGIGSKDEQVSFSSLEIFHFNRTLSASVYGSTDPDRDFPRLLSEVAGGRLDLSSLVTERVGLDGVAGAFEQMAAGRGARTLVLPSS